MTEQTDTRAGAEQARGGQSVVTYRFDAPRELVWRAWTDPERLRQWWGPRGFTSPMARTDLRVGGRYHWGMRSPEGQDFFSTGVFREVVEPERLVMTDSFADAEGNVVPASTYGLPGDWTEEIVITVSLEERDGGTMVTVRSENIPGEMRVASEEGMRESLEKLAEYLQTPGARA